MRRILALVIVAMVMTTATAYGAGGISAGGGARSSAPSSSPSASRPSSSPSSGSKPSSGGGSSSSRPSAGSGGVRPSTFNRPSSGRIQQPAPSARLIPRSLPPGTRIPRGRNLGRDQAALRRNPRYFDPYDSNYYGNPSSPFFYLYLAELQNNNGPHPVAYQGRQCKKKSGHGTGVVVLWAILGLILGLILGFVAGAAGKDY
jgi:hypothetical protein